MAGAGTGIDTGRRGDVATTLADTRGFGAGEAAAAEAFGQAARGIGNLVDVIEPAAQQQAVEIANHDVEAGQFHERLLITGADAKYNQALQQGTLARLSNQRDADLDALKAQHLYDPDGFERAAQEYRSNAIGGAVPPALAMDWSADFDQRKNGMLSTIRGARAQADLKEAQGATEARIDRLTSETIGLATGQPLADVLGSEQVQGNLLQIKLMYDGLAGNAAFGLSQEEVDAKYEATTARIKAGAVSAHVVNTLRTQGQDAAYAELQALQTGAGSYVTPSAGPAPGMVAQGNIDLSTRPTVQNEDGTVSTVRSITIEEDGKAVLIPTVTDDGRVVSDEEAVALYQQTGRHLGKFGTEAEADAYAETLHDDQANGQTGGIGLTKAERDLAFNSARDAVSQEIGLANQRKNAAEAERNAAEAEMNRQIEEDVGRMQLTGQGSGLTEDQVRAVSGNAGVAAWYKKRADALEFNQLVGDLSDKTPDEAAAIIAQRTAERGLGSLPVVQDQGDLDTVAAAMTQVESGGRDGLVSADPDGAGPAGGGAMGRMQVTPDTARRIAGQLGLPFDLNRLRNDGAYNTQIGKAYLQELLSKYNGDTFLAVTAYHAGDGNVDGWLRSVGDPRGGQITREAWLDAVEARGNPRSAEYPRKVLAALGAGRASAAWDTYQATQTARRADPASTVIAEFPVKAAQQRWAAQPQSTPAAEAFVQASLDAQTRANIPSGQRRTLPVASLLPYAAQLQRREQEGDSAGYLAFQQSIVRQFGRHGAAVLQDVLEVQGNTAYSAQISARIAQRAAQGQPPSRTDTADARSASRAETMNRAGNGSTTRSVTAMSNEQVLAAAGLQ